MIAIIAAVVCLGAAALHQKWAKKFTWNYGTWIGGTVSVSPIIALALVVVGEWLLCGAVSTTIFAIISGVALFVATVQTRSHR